MSIRFAITLAIALTAGAAAEADRPRYRPMPSMSEEAYDRLIDQLARHPPWLTRDRLPDHYKMGRCLLEVRGRTLIAGRCAYEISKTGEFEFHGPRQVYAGIDYPKPEAFPQEISTDHFVQVDHELLEGGKVGPGWEAHWNEDKRATHAQSPLGSVTKNGACFFNAEIRICLWR